MEINVSKQPLTVLRSLRNHHPGLSRLLLFECEASEIRRNFSSDRQEPPIFTFELKIQQNVLKYQPNIHTLTPPKKNTRANLINIQITKKKSKVKKSYNWLYHNFSSIDEDHMPLNIMGKEIQDKCQMTNAKERQTKISNVTFIF